jgi:hypothetical protein
MGNDRDYEHGQKPRDGATQPYGSNFRALALNALVEARKDFDQNDDLLAAAITTRIGLSVGYAVVYALIAIAEAVATQRSGSEPIADDRRGCEKAEPKRGKSERNFAGGDADKAVVVIETPRTWLMIGDVNDFGNHPILFSEDGLGNASGGYRQVGVCERGVYKHVAAACEAYNEARNREARGERETE